MNLTFQERFELLLRDLESERNLELNLFKSLLENRPMKERISEGITLYPVDYHDNRYSPFDELILDFRINPDQPGKLFGTSGKCQLFSSVSNEKVDGTIVKITDSTLSLALHDDELPEWIKSGKLGIDAVCDTRTYDIQIQTIKQLLETKRGLVHDFYDKKFLPELANDFSENEKLNNSQSYAVRSILSDCSVHVVHGPPGTGKTRTITDAIVRFAKDGKRILVATPTNAAADHICLQLVHAGCDALRYGNSFKMTIEAEHYSLYTRIQNHPELAVVARLSKDADVIRKKAFRYVRNFDADAQMERKQLRQELKEIQKDIRSIEKQIRQSLVEKAQVIVGTLIGLHQDEILNQTFDALFVDEAGQALEPAIWALGKHVKKLVLAGDPFQLPPVLFAANAQKLALSTSLIEVAIQKGHPTSLLDTQYRMNHKIMQFSNHWFYQNKLKSANENSQRQLENEPFEPIEFIDTAGCSFDEEMDESGGISNHGEADILTKRFKELNLSGKNCGLISPYRKQVVVLDELIKHTSVTVQTIDSFQGQERDIILISLVRSNSAGEIGFLKDYRRMNVAMTRAKEKLILIGDSATLGNDSFYGELLSYIEQNGSYRSAYEYFTD